MKKKEAIPQFFEESPCLHGIIKCYRKKPYVELGIIVFFPLAEDGFRKKEATVYRPGKDLTAIKFSAVRNRGDRGANNHQIQSYQKPTKKSKFMELEIEIVLIGQNLHCWCGDAGGMMCCASQD
jgi:hypothetical protein